MGASSDGDHLSVEEPPDPQQQILIPSYTTPEGIPVVPLCFRSLESVDIATVEQRSRQPVILPSPLAPAKSCSRPPESAVAASVKLLPSRPINLSAQLAPVEPCSRSLESIAFASVEQSYRCPSNLSRPAALPDLLAPVEPCSRSIESSVFVVASVEQRSRRPDVLLALIAPVEPCSRSQVSAVFLFASVEQRSRRSDVSPAQFGSVEPGSRPLVTADIKSLTQHSHHPAVLPVHLAPVEPRSRSLEKAGFILVEPRSRRPDAQGDRRIFVVGRCRTIGPCPVSDNSAPIAGGGVPYSPAVLRAHADGDAALYVARDLVTSTSYAINALVDLVLPSLLVAHQVRSPYPEVLIGFASAELRLNLVSLISSDQNPDLEALNGISSVAADWPVMIFNHEALLGNPTALIAYKFRTDLVCSLNDALVVPDACRWIWLDGTIFLSFPVTDTPSIIHDPGAGDT